MKVSQNIPKKIHRGKINLSECHVNHLALTAQFLNPLLRHFLSNFFLSHLTSLHYACLVLHRSYLPSIPSSPCQLAILCTNCQMLRRHCSQSTSSYCPSCSLVFGHCSYRSNSRPSFSSHQKRRSLLGDPGRDASLVHVGSLVLPSRQRGVPWAFLLCRRREHFVLLPTQDERLADVRLRHIHFPWRMGRHFCSKGLPCLIQGDEGWKHPTS